MGVGTGGAGVGEAGVGDELFPLSPPHPPATKAIAISSTPAHKLALREALIHATIRSPSRLSKLSGALVISNFNRSAASP